MITLHYETDKLNDIKTAKSIAEKVNQFFGDSNLIDTVQRSFHDDSLKGAGLTTKVYNYNGASAIVRDYAFTAWDVPRGTETAVPLQIGIVSCKVAGNDSSVLNYIQDNLEKVYGLKKDNYNYNLPQ